jgi:inosose dehydratase
VDFADAPNNPPWQEVLDDIAASGIGALELGPVGYLPEDPDALRSALGERALTAVGSYVFEALHDPARAEETVALAERASRAIAAAGGQVLVIIDCPDAARAATAGRSVDAPRLPDDDWEAMLDLIGRLAVVAREHRLRPVVHPHAGTYLEFADEVERLVQETDLDLCLDTGHLAYAGIDPVGALHRYADRLGHVHLKDIRSDVLRRVHAEELGFWAAIAAGIFCPLGEGVVDIGAVLRELVDLGYAGYATIEQDRVPGHGTPLDDLRRSVAVIDEVSTP